MPRILVRYLAMILPPLLGIFFLLELGKGLTPAAYVPGGLVPPAATLAAPFDLLLLLIQVGVILAAARLFGPLFRRVGQPQVVGEMLAGITLGPSVLGRLAPGLSTALFPLASLGYLNGLSQVGLVVFMFLVGLALDPALMRGRTHAAVVTSHVSILFPFFLGTILAFLLYPRLASAGVEFSNFALFVGVSMSITAFPVLARVLGDHDLINTPIGAVAISCAAIDDASSWMILAAIVLIVRSAQAGGAIGFTVIGTVASAGFMLSFGRRWLARLGAWHREKGEFTQDLLGLVLLLVIACSALTESLGIHALFGAFLLGVVMPKEPAFIEALTNKLDALVMVLLLPIYFAFIGLRTNLEFITGSPETILIFVVILIVAVAGKFGGATIASRWSGLSWREASAIGVLMNTRGLVELVALSIGLELGVISPPLFTMMVFMALLTTLMTAPALRQIYLPVLPQSRPVQVNGRPTEL